MTEALVISACRAIATVKYTIVEAEHNVVDVAGLYAIYGTPGTWRQLGLRDPSDGRPLYVGKAEASLKARDLKQHFKSGSTGASTVRRTFAAMLRDALGFRGVPRNKTTPGKWSHFALDDNHEAALSEWMRENLTLAVWPEPHGRVDLHAIERGVVARLVPPLNLQDNPTSRWREQVSAARKVMAQDANAWRAFP